jgi:hypothetical protein
MPSYVETLKCLLVTGGVNDLVTSVQDTQRKNHKNR